MLTNISFLSMCQLKNITHQELEKKKHREDCHLYLKECVLRVTESLCQLQGRMTSV